MEKYMEDMKHNAQLAQTTKAPFRLTDDDNDSEAAGQATATDERRTPFDAFLRADIEFISIKLSGTCELVEFVARVPNFPRFAASADGRVFRLSKGRTPTWHEVQSFKIKNGYLQVSLHNEAGNCVQYVHRVVAAAFLKPPPSPAHQIDHLWGDKTDNHVANLRWVTRAENIAARMWQKQVRIEMAAYRTKATESLDPLH